MPARSRPDSSKNATQLILNLLELMAAQGVERSQETYDLLLRHWADRRIFKAVLATVEDMAAAGLTPNPQHIRSAAYDADSVRTSILRSPHLRCVLCICFAGQAVLLPCVLQLLCVAATDGLVLTATSGV